MPGHTGQAPVHAMQVDVRFGPIPVVLLPIAKVYANKPGANESVGRL